MSTPATHRVGRFELHMNSHLDLVAATVPGPRTAPEAEDARSATEGASGATSPGAGQLADRAHGSSGF
jgi:hypothetical protein